MPLPVVLVSTWDNGLFSVAGDLVRHELAGQMVCSLTPDGRGGVFAIVDGQALCRRSAEGAWSVITKSELPLSCCVATGNAVFVGTDEAQVLRVALDGSTQPLTGFNAVEGRETWYAGAAMVDGKLMGPPLGIRSIATTCDHATLLANVHVGGVPRSTDGGATWQPTIAVESDVHQVCTHPTRPDLVIAASAMGLCLSRDGGCTWTIEDRGLHAPHCSGVAFGTRHMYVSASVDPFTPQGAVYRRPLDSDGPLQLVESGMPRWTEGVVDTNCMAARDSTLAITDRAGWIYVSQDDGAAWTRLSAQVPTAPSAIYIC